MSEETQNLGGRPPIYNTPEELESICNEYFKKAEGEYEEITKIDDDGKKYKERIYSVPEEKITITGLALYLGFCSRSTLYEYEKKEGFSYIIKKAMLRVENGYETNLHNGQPTGSIFALKNMGWKDKSEMDINDGMLGENERISRIAALKAKMGVIED